MHFEVNVVENNVCARIDKKENTKSKQLLTKMKCLLSFRYCQSADFVSI